jgi:hypothetical protein
VSDSNPQGMPLMCPHCYQFTGSLKQYRYVRWCVFLLSAAFWQATYYRACPRCMRQFIWRRCHSNVLSANLLWLLWLLPWAWCLVAASRTQGHSRAVLRGETPEMVAAKEAAQYEVSWGRVFTVVSLLFFWAPLIGLAFSVVAYLLNRRSPTWTRRASQGCLIASVTIHLALVALIVVSEWNTTRFDRPRMPPPPSGPLNARFLPGPVADTGGLLRELPPSRRV